MERLIIFCFYNPSGRLTRDVEYLLSSLRQCAKYVVIVVNGKMDKREKLENYSEYIIFRENKGYDAGAYKCALEDQYVHKLLNGCDELILCNDTFYGPFVSFREIFEEMANQKADFWGLNLSDNGLITFIQSYFLVFKIKIWERGDLQEFFEKAIDENTQDFKKILVSFEQGIFTYLTDKGYKYGALRQQRYHVLSSVDGSICYDKLPLLKKKAFSDKFYNKKKILNALSYIDRNYDYDVGMILEDIKEKYSVNIGYNEIKQHAITVDAEPMVMAKVTKENLSLFVNEHKKIYIYGAGAYGKFVLKTVGKNLVQGFIVSDDQIQIEEKLYDIPIYKISDLVLHKDIPIIVALNINNSREVSDKLKKFENVLYIFED